MTLDVPSVFTSEKKQARTKKSRDRCPKYKQKALEYHNDRVTYKMLSHTLKSTKHYKTCNNTTDAEFSYTSTTILNRTYNTIN